MTVWAISRSKAAWLLSSGVSNERRMARIVTWATPPSMTYGWMKPSRPSVVSGARLACAPEKLPSIVKGQAVCLYSDLVGENLWIAADEDDAQILVSQGERRGQIYTPEEARLIFRIADAEIVKQVHAFKRLCRRRTARVNRSC